MRISYSILPITILLSIVVCCRKQSEKKSEVNIIGASSLSMRNRELSAVISNYIKLNEQDKKPKVYRLVIEQGNAITSLKLTYIRNYSEVFDHPPTSYFIESGRVVLINTGLESFSKPDSVFIKSLHEIILPNLRDDVTINDTGTVNSSILYYSPVWDLQLHGNDSISVNRKGKAPYVRYLPKEEQIKFEPPKNQ